MACAWAFYSHLYLWTTCLIGAPAFKKRGHRDLLKNGAKESFEPQYESLEPNLGALEAQVTNTLTHWVITPDTRIVFLMVSRLEHFDDFLTFTKKNKLNYQ